MKNCPYCKAEIEDNARFCLYCMRSLNEKTAAAPLKKHRPWYLLILGVLLLGAVAVVLLLPKGNSTPTSSSAPTGQLLQQSAATESTGTLPPTTVQVPDSSPTEDTTVPAEEVILPDPQPQETPVSTKPVATKPPETVPTTTPTTAPTTAPTTEPTIDPDDPYANWTAPSVAGSGRGFEYALAGPWALEDPDYVNTGDGDIVLTRVNDWDDVLRIPSSIDGKRVVATRFHYPPGATTFYIPSTVRFIGRGDPYIYTWDESPFEYAGDMEHLYLEGNNTHFEMRHLILSGTTLHCSAKARNRYGQYYKDIAADYGVIWEEWNGYDDA